MILIYLYITYDVLCIRLGYLHCISIFYELNLHMCVVPGKHER